MYNIAKKILESYIREQKILTIPELKLTEEEKKYLDKKDSCFVTVYKEWAVIWSSWRINIKRDNTILELIDNTLQTLKDERFVREVRNVWDLHDIKIRIDILPGNSRKVIKNLDTINTKNDWLILITQDYEKLWVILPNMTPLATNWEDLFHVVCKKAWVDKNTIKENEYILYKINTISFSDF